MNRVFLLFLAVIGCQNMLFSSAASQEAVDPEITLSLDRKSTKRGKSDLTSKTETKIIADAVVVVEGSGEEMLQAGFIPGTEVRLQLVSLENDIETNQQYILDPQY